MPIPKRTVKVLMVILATVTYASGIASDEQAIRALIGDLEKAYNNNESILGFLTPGGDMRPFEGPVLKHADLARQPTPVYRVTPMKRTVEQLRFLKPDLALVDGRLQEIASDGKTMDPVMGRFTYVFLKQGATWRIEASRMALSARH